MSKVYRCIGLVLVGLVISFGGFGVTQPDNVSANTNVVQSCSSWEYSHTTRTCVHLNQTIVREYEKRYCPTKGWEYRIKNQYTINACLIAS